MIRFILWLGFVSICLGVIADAVEWVMDKLLLAFTLYLAYHAVRATYWFATSYKPLRAASAKDRAERAIHWLPDLNALNLTYEQAKAHTDQPQYRDLPGVPNGAVTCYLMGECDVRVMERQLDRRYGLGEFYPDPKTQQGER